MKICSLLFMTLSLLGCARSTVSGQSVTKANNAQVYAYRDVSGEFEYAREVKFSQNKLATRVQVLAEEGGNERLLEKTFALSVVGSIKGQGGRVPAIRPELSQHTVWLDGKKYFSQLKLNPKKKVIEAIMDSPDPKWKGKTSIKVPRGRIFCFYSQLPECLALSSILVAAESSRRDPTFILVWDSWPYHQEHFTGLKNSPFANARISAEKGSKSERRYNVDVNGQNLSLHFSNEYKFVRMFWTAQGISLLPPGEKQNSEEM